jgi:hypothetical protein
LKHNIPGNEDPTGANREQELVSSLTLTQYRLALSSFDAALCEAYAVSQAQAGRRVRANIGYAIMIFARLCGTGVSMIRAAPYSRWVKSDFENWDFSAIAGHARTILDGYLSFIYLIAPCLSDAEMAARVHVMNLNESTRRMQFHKNLGSDQSKMSHYETQQDEIRKILLANEYFIALPEGVQRECLSGKYMMIESRDRLLDKLHYHYANKLTFNAIYDIWSQYLHILPLSFYRMESNGRGCGVENDVDRTYMGHALLSSAEVLKMATDEVVKIFPDISHVREGINSKFSPGPRSNRPKPNSSKKGRLKKKKPFLKNQKRWLVQSQGLMKLSYGVIQSRLRLGVFGGKGQNSF